MKKIVKRIIKNFPILVFFIGVVLLVLSLFFKAYDMAVVSFIPLIGAPVLCVYHCYLDVKYERKIADYKANLRDQSALKTERLCKSLDEDFYSIPHPLSNVTSFCVAPRGAGKIINTYEILKKQVKDYYIELEENCTEETKAKYDEAVECLTAFEKKYGIGNDRDN